MNDLPVLDRVLAVPAGAITPFDTLELLVYLAELQINEQRARGVQRDYDAERKVAQARQTVQHMTRISRTGNDTTTIVRADEAISRTGNDGREDASAYAMLAKEVAEVLGLKTTHRVNQLARSGELPAVKRGRHWMFRPVDVTSFKEERNADLGRNSRRSR